GITVQPTDISEDAMRHWYALHKAIEPNQKYPEKQHEMRTPVVTALKHSIFFFMALESIQFISEFIDSCNGSPKELKEKFPLAWGRACFPGKTKSAEGPKLVTHSKFALLIPYFETNDHCTGEEIKKQCDIILRAALTYLLDNVQLAASLLKPLTNKTFLSAENLAKLNRGRTAFKTHTDVVGYLKASMNALYQQQDNTVAKQARVGFANSAACLIANPLVKLAKVSSKNSVTETLNEIRTQICTLNQARVDVASEEHGTPLERELNPLFLDRFILQSDQLSKEVTICTAQQMSQGLARRSEAALNCFHFAFYLIMCLAGQQRKMDNH